MKDLILRKERFHLITATLIVFVISWIVMGYMIYLGGLKKAGALVFILMWIPGLVTLLYRLVSKIGFRDVGWKLGSLRYWLSACLVPLAVAAISYAVFWLTGISAFEIPSTEILQRNGVTSPIQLIFKIYPLLIAIGYIAALGEELAWRGFLVPKLHSAEIRYPLIISALIWGIWHWPLVLWGGYSSSKLPAVSFFFFTVMALCGGVFIRMASDALRIGVGCYILSCRSQSVSPSGFRGFQ